MPTVITWPFADTSFVDQLDGLFEPWEPTPAPEPELLLLNEALAHELGFDVDALRSADGLATLAGAAIPPGTTPVAQAYAGHQFGGYSPRLGDGRAVLLGEIVDRDGVRRDLHLKGSGRTSFSRGGDGRAAVGPMVREHIVSEAMAGLGIPTTRSLAVVATGAPVRRETILPGAVLARVASSHLRVGTFQYAAATGDLGLLGRLRDHAIARHHPAAAEAERPALALLEAVIGVQAATVARWMMVGFVHGVMNTDNTTISGETIDYGPCAFIDAVDPAAVYSSIDHGGRYAYGNQPAIAGWNLARLAEALLPVIDDDQERAVALATEVMETYPDRYNAAHEAAMAAKLGVDASEAAELSVALLEQMHAQQVDHTAGFRALSEAARGDAGSFRSLFAAPALIDGWLARWQDLLPADRDAAATAMDAVNPIYIARNHLVEEALAAATAGDLGPTHRLVEVLTDPFTRRPGLERYAEGAPESFGTYRTFCGT